MEYTRRIPRMARSADHERHPVRRLRHEAHSAPVSVRWSLSSFDNINPRPRPPRIARRRHRLMNECKKISSRYPCNTLWTTVHVILYGRGTL